MKEKQSKKAGRPAMPELLGPAGSLEKLAAAVHYGVDAVYLGGPDYGLRARAGTFDEAAMRRAVSLAHQSGVAVYVTVNIIAHNRDFVALPDYLQLLQEIGVDAIIVADPGVVALAGDVVPGLPLHLSTQANVTNAAAAAFWQRQGVRRLNLARELSLAEIRAIRAGCGAEIEIFVHGALCISYSGRCLLSHYLTGRDANRGHCAHPCRYRYALVEEKRPGQWYPIEEDERGAYIFNAKDLCLLGRLPELVAAGVDSLKIEGRMKSLFYVGSVVRAYRVAMDYLQTLGADDWLRPEKIVLPDELLREIALIGTRDLTMNFIDEPPGAADMLYGSSRSMQHCEPVAVVREVTSLPLVEVRNALTVGERIEYMHRSGRNSMATVTALFDERWQPLDRANPGNRVYLSLAEPVPGIAVHSLFRRRLAAPGEPSGT
jgi:U32 family peptidase